ncbi:MAG: hypothetical protein OQL19_07080 [Gammaproteobacteria bacterium]|nr:hypothetical protein [Gammaproteobacteria bacterium]
MKKANLQDEQNNAEWKSSNNWSSIYFSKKDSRTFVPKRNPKLGQTINFGSPSGARWIYYLFAFFFLLGCLVGTSFSSILMMMN